MRASFDSSTFLKKDGILVYMMRIVISFELGQKVSSTLSILLILLLSVLVALLTLRAARDIIDMAQTSPVFRIENRTGASVVGVDQ